MSARQRCVALSIFCFLSTNYGSEYAHEAHLANGSFYTFYTTYPHNFHYLKLFFFRSIYHTTHSSVAGVDGLVGMYSYRDPSPQQSLQTFAKCLGWVVTEGNVTERHVDEAKLVVFAGMDAPRSPQHKGLREFLSDLSLDDVKEKRTRLLAVTQEDVLRVAKTFLPDTWTQPVAKEGDSLFEISNAVVAGERTWKVLSDTSPEWKKWSKFA